MVSTIVYSVTERCGEPAFADRRLRRRGGRAPQAVRPATRCAGRRGPGGAQRLETRQHVVVKAEVLGAGPRDDDGLGRLLYSGGRGVRSPIDGLRGVLHSCLLYTSDA